LRFSGFLKILEYASRGARRERGRDREGRQAKGGYCKV